MTDQVNQLKAIAADCREAAKFYETHPGLAGHGVNVSTVIDIYHRIAMSLDVVVAAFAPQERSQP
jgi:5-enolpyruvylshikimate-3-phosphate synthase